MSCFIAGAFIAYIFFYGVQHLLLHFSISSKEINWKYDML